MLLFISLLFFLSANAQNTNNERRLTTRIAGGRPIPITTAPWQAQLCENGVQICGAAIIAPYWVLTAAHCMLQSKPVRTIRTGSDKVSEGEVHSIQVSYVHPSYDAAISDSDIALVLLNEKIEFTDHQNYIKLASRRPIDGENMFISGFGKRGESKDYASVLVGTSVPVINHEVCQQNYKQEPVTLNMFCAGTKSKDSCEGDSGGPAVINNELMGIVSAGFECTSSYGIYTTVYNYIPWILHYVQPKAGEESEKPTYQAVQPTSKVYEVVGSYKPPPRTPAPPRQQESGGNIFGGVININSNILGSVLGLGR